MNEFTKEELLMLIEGMDDYYYTEIPSAVILKTKIQSMIDNYCDHLWTDGGGNNIYCVNCHILGGRR